MTVFDESPNEYRPFPVLATFELFLIALVLTVKTALGKALSRLPCSLRSGFSSASIALPDWRTAAEG